MKSVWSMNTKELLDLRMNFSEQETEKVDVGDITIACHTSNQAHLLQPLIDSVRVITDKIIILDDCSQDNTVEVAKDNGCEVYSIPEGWLYTHGFGKLIEFQVSVCKSDYHFQLDTGETLFVPKRCPLITGNIAGNMWLNETIAKEDLHGFQQTKFNRLLSTKVPVVFPAYIHGAPRGIGHNTTKSELVIFHGKSKNQNWTKHYVDRRNRLYFKLLKKGFDDKKLENAWWYNYCVKSKDAIERTIKDTESRIGVLEETNDQITRMI